MNLILKKDNLELSTFESIHNRIIICRDQIKLYLYELCKAMKEMHESKAYISAGYNSFEEYTVDCFGIKKSQAYDYVKIASKYSEEFFSKHGGLGITKLQLFNKMNEAEVEQFLNTHDVEDMSTREVKSAISKYNQPQDKAIDAVVSDSDEGNEPISLVVDIIDSDIEIKCFGDFLKSKRTNKGYSISHLAKQLNLAKGYYANVESGLRPPFSKSNDVYNKIIHVLDLNNTDIKLMHELVDHELLEKGKISPDITRYLLENPEVINRIREETRR